MTNCTKCDINLSRLSAFLILLHSILGFSFQTYILFKHVLGEGKHALMQLTAFRKNKTRNYDLVF